MSKGQQQAFEQVAKEVDESPLVSEGKRRMAMGALFAVGGGLVTLFSLASAKPGGRYTVFYGAVLWGVIAFVRGFLGWAKNRVTVPAAASLAPPRPAVAPPVETGGAGSGVLVPADGQPLGSAQQVMARIADLLPGTQFDRGGMGRFTRPGYGVEFRLEGDPVERVAVACNGGGGAQLALKRLVSKTGWQLCEAERQGLSVSRSVSY